MASLDANDLCPLSVTRVLRYSFHFGKVKENIIWSLTWSLMFAYFFFFFKRRKDRPTYNVQNVWNMGFAGKGVVVAVVDNGLEKNHLELEKNFVSFVTSDLLLCSVCSHVHWPGYLLTPLFTIQVLWQSVATKKQSNDLKETVSCGSASLVAKSGYLLG